MKTIATAKIITDVPAQRFFERWADMSTWPQWNTDTEWVRLDGPFRTGATGRLKPKGGPVAANGLNGDPTRLEAAARAAAVPA